MGSRSPEVAMCPAETPAGVPPRPGEPAAVPTRALDFGFGRALAAVLLAWLAMLGVDFFLHAGLLARFYVVPQPGVLPPGEAARLIPLGYASFLVWAVLIEFLVVRLRAAGARRGFLLGLGAGLLVQGATVLGSASILTVPRLILAAWAAGQAIQLAAGGMVSGSALAGARLGPLALKVLAFVGALFVITVVLQSTGLAPAIMVPAP
jgi:hypothetical protein